MRITRMIVALMASSAIVFAQTTAPSSPVVAVEAFTHIVQNVEGSAAFYREVVGLQVVQPPTQFKVIPWVNAVGDTPRAQIRTATFRAPDSPLIIELAEYKGLDRRPPVKPHYQDPGVTVPIFYVRNMETVMTKIKQTKAEIVTVGGKPITSRFDNDLVDDVFVQDPDGFFFGLSHHTPLPTTKAAPSSNVIGESLEFVANDLDQTLRVYKGVFGFAMPPSAPFLLFKANGAGRDPYKAVNEGGNTPGATTKTSNGSLPGRSHPNFGTLRYLEYQNIRRTPLHTRLQDPGSTVLRLAVRDLAKTIKQLNDASVDSITKGGEPVVMDSSQYFMVRDPDNIYLDLVQRSNAE